MAIYRCEIKTHSRSDGANAIAASAYRTGSNLRDPVTGKQHNYSNRKDIAAQGVVAPEAWAEDRQALWSAAEAAETRKNSVVAREALVSLPHELDDAQRASLVAGFAAWLSARYGVAVDYGIHRPDHHGGDARNHHAHMLMTTRSVTADGFGAKTRSLDDRKSGEIDRIREAWERHCNDALADAGSGERVDRRSLKDREIQAEPQPKMGKALHTAHTKAQHQERHPDQPPKAWPADQERRHRAHQHRQQAAAQVSARHAKPPPRHDEAHQWLQWAWSAGPEAVATSDRMPTTYSVMPELGMTRRPEREQGMEHEL